MTTNGRFLNLAALALVSSLAFPAQMALAAEGASCGNWSFNDPSCSAYIKPSGKMTEKTNEMVSSEPASCGNWSFNDPSCSAYLKPSGKQTEVGTFGSGNTNVCSLSMFNSSPC